METLLKCATLSPFAGSYRTYEEWKPLSPFAVLRTNEVLTVPMRNGNVKKKKSDFFFFFFVLTVPMRNGNTKYKSVLHLK